MLYIPSWAARVNWNHNYKLHVGTRSHAEYFIGFIVLLQIVNINMNKYMLAYRVQLRVQSPDRNRISYRALLYRNDYTASNILKVEGRWVQNW